MLKKEWIDLLLKSLDETLSPQEEEQLNALFEQSEELRVEREKFLRLRMLVKEAKPNSDAAFADRLMDRLQHLPVKTVEATILRLFPKVAAACVLILLVSMLGIYFTEGSLSSEVIIGLQDLSPEDAYSLSLDN